MAEKYTVTDVKQRTRFSRAGTEQTFYDVYIITERGDTGFVRVEAAQYDKEQVKKELDILYARLELAYTL